MLRPYSMTLSDSVFHLHSHESCCHGPLGYTNPTTSKSQHLRMSPRLLTSISRRSAGKLLLWQDAKYAISNEVNKLPASASVLGVCDMSNNRTLMCVIETLLTCWSDQCRRCDRPCPLSGFPSDQIFTWAWRVADQLIRYSVIIKRPLRLKMKLSVTLFRPHRDVKREIVP